MERIAWYLRVTSSLISRFLKRMKIGFRDHYSSIILRDNRCLNIFQRCRDDFQSKKTRSFYAANERRRRRDDIKMVPEERRSKRIAGPYPVGDISFSGEQERALSRFPIRFSHFAALTRPSRERTITFFLFSFNYRCQGVALLSPPPSSPRPPSTSGLATHFFPSLDVPLLFLYLFQLSARREFVIAFNFPTLSRSFHGHSAARRRASRAPPRLLKARGSPALPGRSKTFDASLAGNLCSRGKNSRLNYTAMLWY